MKGSAFVFLCSILLVSSAWGRVPSEAIDYFQEGDFPQARSILKQYLSTNPTDQKALFYLAQMELDGRKSIDYFDKLMSFSKDFEQEEEALLRMCQYNFSKGLYLASLDLAEGFERKFKRSPHYPQILWISGSARLALGETGKAREKYELLFSFSENDWRARAKLGMGDCLLADGRFSSAIDQYKEIMDEFEDSDLLSTALIQIANCYAQMGEKDKTILYFNLYKEKSPYGIRVDEDLTHMMKPQEIKKEKPSKAEQLVNARYTIQLGVFGVKSNADRLYSKFKAKGYTVRILEKTINNKKYYIVQLGSFDSYEKAQSLRQKLEEETKESYRIVLR